MADPMQEFVDSYGRIGAEDPDASGFFEAFYARFVGASPEVAEKFRRTDMARQREMLRMSLDHMVYFAIDREETTRLANVAVAHGKSKANIPPHLYDLWLDSLLETVREFDPGYGPHTKEAWKNAMRPAIAYMKQKFDES